MFVIGDMVSLEIDNKPVPGVAPAAMQMADQTAANILGDFRARAVKNFKYNDQGSMATIGRSKAIVDLHGWKFTGLLAWLMWLFVHIISLIGFKNRLYVLSEWFWAYLTRERSARLITGDAEELRDALLFLQRTSGHRGPETPKKPPLSADKCLYGTTNRISDKLKIWVVNFRLGLNLT